MSNIATLISKHSNDNNEVFAKYIRLREELDIIEVENKVKKEEKILESWESLFGSMSGIEEEFQPEFPEEVIEFPLTDEEVIEEEQEQPPPLPIQEEFDFIEEQEQQETTTTVEDFASTISEEEKNKPKLQEQVEDPIAVRIRKLEDMLRQLAMAGPGGGEVRLLKLDDVDTTNLANDKILKYNSTTSKFEMADASGATHAVTSGSTSITSALSGVAINTQILDTPAGYISIEVSGTTYKLPYYPA